MKSSSQKFHLLTIVMAMNVFMLTAGQLKAAQLLFTPELNLSEQYSDNIYLTPENEEHDYISAAGLNLTLQALGRTAGLELNLNPSYNAFADHSELNYWRYSGRLRLWNDPARNTRLELISDYLETENPRDQSTDFTPEDPSTGPAIRSDLNRRGRNRYRNSVSTASLSHQFGARDQLRTAVLYSYREDIDTVSGQQVNDFTNWQPSLGLEYWLAQRFGVAFDGYFSSRDYTDRNDRQEYFGDLRLLYALQERLSAFIGYRHTILDYDQETDADYQIYQPHVGFTYQFQETARITIGAGYYIQDFDGRDENEEEWTVNSEIFKRWNFRFSYISLAGSSGYEIEDQGTQDLGLNIYYRARLEAGYRFTSRFSGNIYGSYRRDDYPNDIPDRTVIRINTGTSLSYQALQWMFFNLTYNYADVSSDLDTEEYTENSVILMVTLRPAAPFRLN